MTWIVPCHNEIRGGEFLTRGSFFMHQSVLKFKNIEKIGFSN